MFGVVAFSPPQGQDQTFWLAIAGCGGVLLYFILRQRGRKRDPLDTAPPRFPLGKQREVETQMNSVLVELSRMTREITAQLDTRSTKLELLIKEADEKLSALRAATNAVQITAENNNSRPDTVIAEEEAVALQTLPEENSAKFAPVSPITQRYSEVYSLADEGKPANEIARILQRPTGEIELILALRPKPLGISTPQLHS